MQFLKLWLIIHRPVLPLNYVWPFIDPNHLIVLLRKAVLFFWHYIDLQCYTFFYHKFILCTLDFFLNIHWPVLLKIKPNLAGLKLSHFSLKFSVTLYWQFDHYNHELTCTTWNYDWPVLLINHGWLFPDTNHSIFH